MCVDGTVFSFKTLHEKRHSCPQAREWNMKNETTLKIPNKKLWEILAMDWQSPPCAYNNHKAK